MSIFNQYERIQSLLFKLDPEKAHELTLSALKIANSVLPAPKFPEGRVQLLGKPVRNLVGLAAGLDKNAACVDGLARLGFGFIEVGTVTPRAQPGNPKPRMFRITETQSIINRMGFNNEGLEKFIQNIRQSSYQKNGGMIGLNIGKNADTPVEQATQDYLLGLRGVYPYADYITINISSPNTKNLRDLQQQKQLNELLSTLAQERSKLSDEHGKNVPILLKIAPDLTKQQVLEIAEVVSNNKIEGVIATNTTLSRDAVKQYQHGNEAGGLSGPPVHPMSLTVIETLRKQLGKNVTIIGVGGIMSGQQAAEKIQAGANAVQLYTGLVYRGPQLVEECVKALNSMGN